MKKCNRCGIEKDFSEFTINSKRKDGSILYRSRCKKCESEVRRTPESKERDKKSLAKRMEDPEYRMRRKYKSKEWFQRPENQDYIKKYNEEYYKRSDVKKRRYDWNVEYYKRPEVIELKKKHKRKYYEKNKDQIKKKSNEYSKRPEVMERNNKLRKDRYYKKKNDHMFMFMRGVKSLVSSSLKWNGYNKNSRTYNILGIDFEGFKEWLERDGLKIKDIGFGKGKVQRDHIVPVALPFKLTEEEAIALNHYTNFRLISAVENNKKKNNLPHESELPDNMHPLVCELYWRARSIYEDNE